MSTPLVMDDACVHYKFVFDVGRTVDLAEAATRILNTDLGVVGVTQQETWDATRLNKIKRLKRDFELLREFSRSAEGGVGPLVRHALWRPRTLWTFFRARRAKNEIDTDQAGDDAAQENLTLEDVEVLIQETEAAIAEQSKLQALLRHVDSEVFNPDFISQDPWLRVELQPVFGKSGDSEYDIDVGLLLHRSGTAILTFYVMHDDPIPVADLGRISLASQFEFEETELPSWVAEAAAATYPGWEVTPADSHRFDAGIPWSLWQQSTTLRNVFEVYKDALVACLNAKRPNRLTSRDAETFSSQWAAYPVVCVRRPDPRCFDRHDKDAERQLGALLARVGDGDRYHEGYLQNEASKDLSLSTTRRFWVNAGAAVVLISPTERGELAQRFGGDAEIPGQEWVYIEQHHAVPIDFLLLQYHCAHALLSQIASSPLDHQSLHRVKARLLSAKNDLQAPSRFTYGSLRDVEEAFHEGRGTPEAWDLAHDSLQLVEGVLDAEDRAAAARRSLSLEMILGIVAIVLGVPAMHQIVQMLGATAPLPDGAYGGLERALNWVSTTAAIHSAAFVLALIGLLVGLVAAAFLLGRPGRREQAPLATRAEGARIGAEPYQYFAGQNITYMSSDQHK